MYLFHYLFFLKINPKYFVVLNTNLQIRNFFIYLFSDDLSRPTCSGFTAHTLGMTGLAHARYAKPTMYNSFWLLALHHHYHSVSLLYHSSHILRLRHMSLYPHQSMAEQLDTWDSNLIKKKKKH